MPVESFYVRPATCSPARPGAASASSSRNNPFSLRPGEFGLGAWEPSSARYDYLDIGNQVFTNGLADPNRLGQPRCRMTDVGFNWHMTQYVKMFFDWNHAEFNNPVTFAKGKYQIDQQHPLVAAPALLLMRTRPGTLIRGADGDDPGRERNRAWA